MAIRFRFRTFADDAAVDEDGKEVVRQVQKFLQDLKDDRDRPEFLTFTNVEKEGSRKVYLHESVVQGITLVKESQYERESTIQKPELVLARGN